MKRRASTYLANAVSKKARIIPGYGKYIAAAQLAYTGYKAFKSIRGRSGKSGETAVTNQRDYTTQYRKKRMPRRKRKVWRKFVRKVSAVSDRLKGAKTVLFNDEIRIAYGGITAGQGWGIMHLYGRNGTNVTNVENGSADLAEIYNNDPEMKDNFSGALVASNGYVKFMNAVIDITMYNPGSQTAEVDVYKIVYGPNEKQYSSFSQANQDYELTQQNISNGGASGTIQLTTRGATPFNLGFLQSMLCSKIIWKKKFLIAAGQSVFFQHRDPKNRYIKTKDMLGVDTDLTYRGATCSYLFIVKEVNAATNDYTLRVGATRSYSYKCELKQAINRRNQVL